MYKQSKKKNNENKNTSPVMSNLQTNGPLKMNFQKVA